MSCKSNISSEAPAILQKMRAASQRHRVKNGAGRENRTPLSKESRWQRDARPLRNYLHLPSEDDLIDASPQLQVGEMTAHKVLSFFTTAEQKLARVALKLALVTGIEPIFPPKSHVLGWGVLPTTKRNCRY